jgi:hypothetical protein
MKLGMYIMAPEPISTAYLINYPHQSVFLYVYVVRQLLRQNVIAATNTHGIEGLFHALCQRKVGK